MHYYLIDYLKQFSPEKLKEEYAVTFKKQNDLAVFSYDQIYSPKNNITSQCRGSVVDLSTMQYAFLAMDRFFNYGEQNTHLLDFSKAVYYEKLDGSLIKIYKYKDKWYLGTSGTIEAVLPTNAGDYDFKGLVYKALSITTDKEFQSLCEDNLSPLISYNFEIVSPFNLIVTPYSTTDLYFLSARITSTGEYTTPSSTALQSFGAKLLTPVFKEKSIEDVWQYVESLKDRKEGLVAYVDGKPTAKFKNSIYVSLHHVATNTTSIKCFINLVLANECDEYLSYFPHHTARIDCIKDALKTIFDTVETNWNTYKDIEDRKEFAKIVSKLKYSSYLFLLKNTDITPKELVMKTDRNKLIKMIKQIIEESSISFFTLDDTDA